MPFEEDGYLVTDKKSGETFGWDTQAQWEAYQDAEDVVIPGDYFELAEGIPESESNQKLIHRWTLEEQSTPFADRVGNADSTSVSGTTRTAGDWIAGAAREGDGSSDAILTTDWGSFGSSMDSDFAVALSIQTSNISYNDDEALMGVVNDGTTTVFILDVADSDETGLRFFLRDEGGNMIRRVSNIQPDDGVPHRIVFNKTGNSVSDLEVYMDGSEASNYGNQTGDNFSNPANFGYEVGMLARYSGGSMTNHTETVLDDVCVFGDSLTQTEIDSYTEPWS